MTKDKTSGEISAGNPGSGVFESHPADLFDVTEASEITSLPDNSDRRDNEKIIDSGRQKIARKTSRVVIFYDDNTFSEFFPG